MMHGGNSTEGYEWNDSCVLERDIVISNDSTIEEVQALMHRIAHCFPEKAAPYHTIVDDGDIYEMQDIKTGKPQYALVPTGEEYNETEAE